ncbi:MAG: protein kinase [Isosphaeraceae bacterium]
MFRREGTGLPQDDGGRASVLPGSPTVPDRAAAPPRIEPFPSQGDASHAETQPFGDWDFDPPADATQPKAGLDDHDPLAGTALGQYRICELAGKGSMGRVYRAEHLGLNRFCAVKVLDPGLVRKEPLLRDRFWAEARAAAHIVHPNVVTIYNVGSDRGYHFIEMEYVPGGTSLRELMIREGPLDPYLASKLVRQVTLGLQAAHAAGLIHRDVKPANVLLNTMRHAKLADFGLVHRATEADRLGMALAGTPTHMAPELFKGAPATVRSDVYALGVMFYYLVTARLPFASDKISRLIRLHLNAQVPDVRAVVPDVPIPIVNVIERCLAKRPEDRYETCQELSNELEVLERRSRATEDLVREALRGLDCFAQGGREALRIIFRLPQDRLQEVYVESGIGPANERLLSLFSVCGPASPDHFEYALRLNDKLTFGSLCVRTVHGTPMLVMNRTFLRDHVSATDVREALLEISKHSDRIEQLLTNADLY